jgi:hypothetical protein
VSLSIRNAGNTRLLSSHVVPLLAGRERVDAGGVQVVARHVTEGAPDTPPMAPLSLGRDLLPNEETRWEAVLTAPDRPGDYAIEFALESRSIGLLEHFGCAITTATLAVR